MEYIINESQLNIIVESNKKINLFQNLIDREFKNLQDMCENQDQIPEAVCYEIETIEKIVVNDVESIPSDHNPTIVININILYDFMRYKSYDEVVYELQYSLRKSTGLSIKIKYESVNVRSNPQW